MKVFMSTLKHGGIRQNAGRKSLYDEPTKPVRIPESQIENVLLFLKAAKKSKTSTLKLYPQETVADSVIPTAYESPIVRIPLMSNSIAAGFPSPAEDYIEHGIDLNEHLILHKEATYILRVSGWSMIGAGIYDGDEIIVDRAIDPQDNHIVVALLDNCLTVKRFKKSSNSIRLVAENPEFPEIIVHNEQDLIIWGVVTRVLHKV